LALPACWGGRSPIWFGVWLITANSPEQRCHRRDKLPGHHEVPSKTHQDGEATIVNRGANALIDRNSAELAIVETRIPVGVSCVSVSKNLRVGDMIRAHRHHIRSPPFTLLVDLECDRDLPLGFFHLFVIRFFQRMWTVKQEMLLFLSLDRFSLSLLRIGYIGWVSFGVLRREPGNSSTGQVFITIITIP
jgi:hypothetical protein